MYTCFVELEILSICSVHIHLLAVFSIGKIYILMKQFVDDIFFNVLTAFDYYNLCFCVFIHGVIDYNNNRPRTHVHSKGSVSMSPSVECCFIGPQNFLGYSL